MKQMIDTALAVLFYVPGAAELFTFILILTILTLLRKRASWDLVPRAILLTCTVFIAIGIFSTNGPLYYVMLGLIAVISLLGRKYPLSFEKAVLPVTLFAYFACYLLFTFVDHQVIVPAKWTLGERATAESGQPQEQLVEFHFGDQDNQTFGVYSDELATYLKTLALDKVEITVSALYHWGKLAGTSLDKINGKEFDTSAGYAGCVDNCTDAPYPKTFLGIRTLGARIK